MLHLLVVCYLAAFGTGVVSATLACQAYRRYRHRYLRDYFQYLVLMNFIVAVYLLFTYLAANVGELSSREPTVPEALAFELFGMILVAVFVYKLVVTMRGLLGRRRSGMVRSACIAGFSILISCWLVAALLPGEPSVDGINRMAAWVYLALAVAAAVALISTFVQAGSLFDGERRKAARIFSGMHLAIYLADPLVFLLPHSVSWGLISVGFMAVSLVPLLYLRSWLSIREGSNRLRPDRADLIGTFFKRFGISRREGEIVQWILAGKTNAEIGDLLFISPNTVRNHVYNVYRKAGIRNRVELTNRILELDLEG